jgi:hypothetical protein
MTEKYNTIYMREWRKTHPLTAKQKRHHAEWDKAYKKTHPLRHKSGHAGYLIEKYEADCRRQKHRCAICRRLCKLLVDHDHNFGCDHNPVRSCTKCRRGLICDTCNIVLGLFEDNAKRFEAASKYIKKYRRTS